MPGLDIFQEAERQLTICNACRYCEGYCPVFPAIEQRKAFVAGDILYLSHLCHDCRACYYACMYAPPHEFSINIPRLMAEVRIASYRRWSWPSIAARSFADRRVSMALAFISVLVVVISCVLLAGRQRLLAVHLGPGSFYQVVPYLTMVVPSVALFVYGLAIWIRGAIRFWSEAGPNASRARSMRAFLAASRDALSLVYLKGGGPGCFYPSGDTSFARRINHALTFWGFLCALASTTVAAMYQELFHWLPPYSVLSAPVILGSAGGIGLIIGTSGLIWLKLQSDPQPAGTGASGMDYTFLFLLGLTALSGMFTLAFRTTSAMGVVLILHIAFVAALFVSAPYGKFVHFVYRYLALVRNRIEEGSSAQ
jgi:citrate/tricarballylate utilization protein